MRDFHIYAGMLLSTVTVVDYTSIQYKTTKMVKEKEYEFNPIKEQTAGKQSEQVVWSTKSIEKACEGLDKGMPLKASPFIGKVTQLLKPNLVYRRTKEEIEDYIRCKTDVVYFATKCYLMTPTGLQPCVLRDYQEGYLQHVANNRFSIMLACRQAGKSVSTAIACLWKILFNTDKRALILSKSGPAGEDLLAKIKDMFMFLPYHLKCGVMKWNQKEISFDNNSSISTEAFSDTAGLGKTINFLILDEFAWCPPGEVELFYNNIIPTITADTNSNICIMSTQNGFNLFYKIYKASLEGKNIYAPYKVDWYQVPQWDKEKGGWKKRDEAWKQEMIGILGSEENFYYQYGTQFSISNACLVSRECMTVLHEQETKFVSYTENEYNERGIYLTLQHPECLRWHPDYDISNIKKDYFVILVDLAEGSGGDYTVFNIIKVNGKEDYESVGLWHSNKVDLEHSALEFWLLVCQLFNDGNTIISIEYNTYGQLFYTYITNYNEQEYDKEKQWRFNVPGAADGVDTFNIAKYGKQFGDDNFKSLNIPGIKITSTNKPVLCSMLKMLLEKAKLKIYDIGTITELENFEDKNGTGSYKAKYGHDDIIMSFCQLPALEQNIRFKNFLEDIETASEYSNIESKFDMSGYDDFSPHGVSLY